MRIEYHPSLVDELHEIRSYYNARVDTLGDQFVDEFEQYVLRIAAAPKLWMVVDGDIRRALLRRFPFVIFFREVDETTLRILVVKHQRRHPNYGKNRL